MRKFVYWLFILITMYASSILFVSCDAIKAQNIDINSNNEKQDSPPWKEQGFRGGVQENDDFKINKKSKSNESINSNESGNFTEESDDN